MHILIAEDEAIVAHDIAAILKDFGHTIAGIVDPAEDVLAVAEAARPDIVLLDIHTTLRSIADGAIVADTAGRVTFVNALAAELIGLAPEEALGQPLAAVLVMPSALEATTFAHAEEA